MNVAHTPGPWYVHTTADQYKRPVIVSREGRPVANDGQCVTGIVHFANNLAPEIANAEHIVRCVNAHDDLLAALRSIADAPDDQTRSDLVDFARAAIARAEGKS